jgi:hypothetical protein
VLKNKISNKEKHFKYKIRGKKYSCQKSAD